MTEDAISFDQGEYDRDLEAVRKARGGQRGGPSSLETDIARLADELDAVKAQMLGEVSAAKEQALKEIDAREQALRQLMNRAVDVINLVPKFMSETAETLADHHERLDQRESSPLDSRRIAQLTTDLEAFKEEHRRLVEAPPAEDVVKAAVDEALENFRQALPPPQRPTPLSMTLVDEDRALRLDPDDADSAQLYSTLSDLVTEHFWPGIWIEQTAEENNIIAGWSRQQLERLNDAMAAAGIEARTALSLVSIRVGDADVLAHTSATGLDAAQACALTLALASGSSGGEWGEDEEPAEYGPEPDLQGERYEPHEKARDHRSDPSVAIQGARPAPEE